MTHGRVVEKLISTLFSTVACCCSVFFWSKLHGELQKFLDLWKDADPSIAEVEDASQRLAGLRNSPKF
jgi:hypothetical protein